MTLESLFRYADRVGDDVLNKARESAYFSLEMAERANARQAIIAEYEEAISVIEKELALRERS